MIFHDFQSLWEPWLYSIRWPLNGILRVIGERSSFRFFKRLVGRSDPRNKKWWVIFWNDGPKHMKLITLDILVVCFNYTLTQTLVKLVLSSHSKKKTNYCLMQVKSIAECSKGSILQSFRPSLSYHLLLRPLFYLSLSGCIRQVLLFWQHTQHGTQWLSGRVLDSRPRGREFEPHQRHWVVVLEQDTFILA